MTRGKARFIYLQLQLHGNLSRVRRLPQKSLLHEPVTASNVPFNLNLHFSRFLLYLINFNVDWAEPNEFAPVTTACLLIILFAINVTLILFAYVLFGTNLKLIENHFTRVHF